MIQLTVQKAFGDFDPGTSKFFGSPTLPEEWLSDGTVGDDDFFFCQLRLSELSSRDTSSLLPEKGFLYFLLTKKSDTEFVPNVLFTPNEPDTLIDDFNAGFDFIENTDDEYSIDFAEPDDEPDGTKILIEQGDSVTVLQYDPLDDNMPPFLAETEKTACFTINRDSLKNLDFSKIEFYIK